MNYTPKDLGSDTQNQAVPAKFPWQSRNIHPTVVIQFSKEEFPFISGSLYAHTKCQSRSRLRPCP